MPVNLKHIPPPAARPNPPVWWVWALLLLLALVAGIGYALYSSHTPSGTNTQAFWEIALEIPSLIWLGLLVLRIVWFKGGEAMSDGWDKEREYRLDCEIRRGQRALQVLGVSLHSALRPVDDADGQAQWVAFLKGEQALKTQASWTSNQGTRHSRLPHAKDETAEQVLERVLRKITEDVAGMLSAFSADTPVTLLLEYESASGESMADAVWQSCLARSDILQPIARTEENGLAVVDSWLDSHNNTPSLLLVIAFQIAPEKSEGTAEAAVGLLFGNPDIQNSLLPLAILHRPEQTHQPDTESLHYALKQALNWGPVLPENVTCGWRVGVDNAWQEGIATGLMALSCPLNTGSDLHNIDSILGYPGPAAPWVAIACATAQSNSVGPQLIVSGEYSQSSSLWATLVSPV